MPKNGRTSFTAEDDQYLIQYLARYAPNGQGRQGRKIYQILTENAGNRWAWSQRHPWQSWRDHYRYEIERFDRKILKFQKNGIKKGGNPVAGPSKAAASATKQDAEQDRTTQSPKRHGPTTTKSATNTTRVDRDATMEVTKQEKPPSTKKSALNAQQSTHRDPPSSIDVRTVTSKQTILQDKGTRDGQGKPKSSTVLAAESVAGSNKMDTLPPKQPVVTASKSVTTKTTSPSTTVLQRSKISTPIIYEEVSDSQGEEDEEESHVGPVGEEDYMHELFGSDIEEGEDEEQELRSSLPPSSPPHDTIYPNLQDVPDPHMADKELQMPGAFNPASRLKPSQEPTPPKSGHRRYPPSSPPPPTIPISQYPRTLKRKAQTEDFFGTPPPVRSPLPSHVTTMGKPPILTEGPFRNAFKPAYRTTGGDDDDDGETWPPKRKRKAPPKDSEMTDASSTEKKNSLPAPIRPPPTAGQDIGNGLPAQLAVQQPRQGPPQQVNAVPSSSKVKLPTSRSDDLVLKDSSIANRIPPAHPSKRRRVEHSADAHHPAQMPPPSEVAGRHSSTIPSHKHALPINPSDHDIFMANKPPSPKGKGRASEEEINKPPRIDLRTASIPKRHGPRKSISRRQSVLSSHTHSRYSSASLSASDSHRRLQRRESNKSNLSLASSISIGDAELLDIVKWSFKDLGKKYGFSEEVVENLFKATRKYDKTITALEILRAGMLEQQNALCASRPELFIEGAFQEEEVDSDMEIPEGVIPPNRPRSVSVSATATLQKENGRGMGKGRPSSPSTNKRPRPSLNYKPIPPDDLDPPSDYSPPSKTRAGQYARLRNQGREDEALERERRRVVSGNTRGSSVLPRTRRGMGVSPMTNPSPTPIGRERSMVVDEDESADDEMAVVEDGDMHVDEDDRHQFGEEQEELLDEKAHQVDRGLEKPEEKQDKAEVNEGEDDVVESPARRRESEREAVGEMVMDDEDLEIIAPRPVSRQSSASQSTADEDDMEIQAPPPAQHPLKRNSSGQTTMEETEDPAFLLLAEEHRQLALEVTPLNAASMHAFEKKADPDLMRFWTAELLKERVGVYALAQERRIEDSKKAPKEESILLKEYGLFETQE